MRQDAALEEGVSLLGPCVLQAAIAACHARAATPAGTDWARIVALYHALLQAAPAPVVALNRALAVGMADSPQAGFDLVDDLADEPSLTRYHRLPNVRADLLARSDQNADPSAAFDAVAALARNGRDQTLLRERADEMRARVDASRRH